MFAYIRTAMSRCLRHRVIGKRSVSSSTFKQRLPPRRVLDVPVDRFVEAFLEIVARFPVQLALRKRRVNRVPAVMPQSVGHKSNQAVRLAQVIKNHFYKIDVDLLPVSAEIIDLARFALEKCGDDGGAMICEMDLIPH